MKAYLGLNYEPAGEVRVAITKEPAEVLRLPGGRVSPIFAADGQPVATLRGGETILVLFSCSPRALLAALETARRRDALGGARIYMTHGLGSVIAVLPPGQDGPAWFSRWAEHLSAGEAWPLTEGCVARSAITTFAPDVGSDDGFPPEVPVDSDVPDEVAIELEQFNRNIEYFWTRARRYAPEYRVLVGALLDVVETTRQAIVQNLERGDGARFRQAHYVGVANLIEINSCLTMLSSQAMSGVSPLLEGSFGVGEYSLLGIGSVTRAAWRLYSHISSTFARENHLERVRALAAGPPFDASHLAPYGGSSFDGWTGPDIDAFEPPHDELARQHVVYFSSRWGFHQTMQSISISWQCVAAGATPDWTLLTFSHEFLHYHLRELLDELLLDPKRGVEGIVASFNKATADTWGEAAVQLLMAELRLMRDTLILERGDGEERDGRRSLRPKLSMDEAEVTQLVRVHLRDLEEVVVHVLDYVYFYDSNDGVYASSLWHSWALIPNVQRQLPQYVLRTLLAMSSTWRNGDSNQAFDDAAARLDQALESILESEEHGLIGEARALLCDPDARRALRVRFQGSFALVKFVKRYLVSSVVHARLLDDPQAADDGSYRVRPGEFTHDVVGSPIGFLLDTFTNYSPARSRETVELETLWQYLEMT